jgi:hypothetical protein
MRQGFLLDFYRRMILVTSVPRQRRNASMKWLNETFPTRVLVVFASGLSVVVLWKAFERVIG